MTLLIELAVKSTVVAGAALAVLALLGRRSAAERSWVAHAALVVLAALPAAVLVLPRWRLAPPVEAVAEASAVSHAGPVAAPLIDPALLLQALYAGGAALVLAATLVAVLRLVALRRGAAVLADPDWLAALARAKARMKVRSRAALLVSDAVASPVSWGLVRPTIVVNGGLVAARDDAEAVIAHELAHVARLDWAKLIGARLVTALFWFNPLVWTLAAQCHQLREEAADDAVLAAEVPSADYAHLLVEAARCQGRGLIAAHGVAPGKGSLHRRVTRVLDAAARRGPTPAAWAASVAVGAAFFAGPLAALTLEPAEAAVPEARAVAITGATAAVVETRPAVTVSVVPRHKAAPAEAAITLRAPAAAKSAPHALTVAPGASPVEGKLALAGLDPRPALPAKTPAGPRAPKVAIAAADGSQAVTVSGKAARQIRIGDGLTLVGPGKGAGKERGPGALTVAVNGDGASSSASHTMTINGKTVRIETNRRGDAADRGDRRADERDRLEDEADRRADQRDRLKDQAEWRAEAAEWLRYRREAERDVQREVERQVQRQMEQDRQNAERKAALSPARPKAPPPAF
jgi:beta-lactamase regulating signal transducer with metallopeptidase domain